MAEKGKIDTTNIQSKQGFNMIKEFLERVSNDALNIKDFEIVAIKELVAKIEKHYNKYERFHDFMKPLLSPVQKDKYILMLEED